MLEENLPYALTQVIHNFGALTVVGCALVGLKTAPDQLSLKHSMAWFILIAWGAQAVSGLIFGGISLVLYGETPDLHSTAYVALIVKMVCAASGFILALMYVRSAKNWDEKKRHRAFHALTGFGVIALTAAAFLRWFS